MSPSYYLVFSPGDKGDTKSHHYSEGGSQGKLEVDKVGQLRQCQHVCEDLRLVIACCAGCTWFDVASQFDVRQIISTVRRK